MGRCVHFLPGNLSNEQPNNIVWFDTETKFRLGTDKRQYHYLWFGWACFQRRESGEDWHAPVWFRFTDIDSFWTWTIEHTRPKTRLYLMSHQGGFDLPVMHAFSELPARGFELKSAIGDAPPLIICWRKDSRTIKYIDTLNIWREPLQRVGESIGLPKLPMPAPTASKSTWDTYGKRDTEIIRQAVLQWLRFLRQHDLGGFAPTLASQALKTYRHRFMAVKILIDNDQRAQQLARRAYFGGRCECFRIGRYRGEFYYLDVNSMYPAVMANGQYPTKLCGVYAEPTKPELVRWLEHRCVVADVELDTDQPDYPVRHDGRLVFPIGRFQTSLCGPELAHALQHGRIKRMDRAAVYHCNEIFRDFVTFMYDQRLQQQLDGNGPNDWFFKRLLNSLYGKFGQRGRRFENYGTCDPDEIEVWTEINAETHEVTQYRKFGGIIQEGITEDEGRESFPAIAAYVTSYARRVLADAIAKAGRENCYYCDTDSLVVNRAGYHKLQALIHPTELGRWALDRELTDLTLHGPKDYIFDGVQRVKGVRKTAHWINDNTVVQDHFVGFKGLLRVGSLDAPIVYPLQKTLSRTYTKGLVSPSGVVTPLRFNDRGSGGDWTP